MIDKECLKCGFYDEDFECTCPCEKKEVMQMQPTVNKGFGLLFEMGCG